jgi:hypothetical protein
MDVNFFLLIKATLNTLIRLSPIGLYAGSIMSSLIFSDFRGTLLILGFIFNEMISLGYRMIFRAVDNPQCALLRNGDTNLTLPSPINQTIGFFVGFILMDMYQKGDFLPLRFFASTIFLLIGVWSRINVGCSAFLDTLFSTTAGLIFGIAYYNIISPYYISTYSLNSSGASTTISTSQQNFFKVGS